MSGETRAKSRQRHRVVTQSPSNGLHDSQKRWSSVGSDNLRSLEDTKTTHSVWLSTVGAARNLDTYGRPQRQTPTSRRRSRYRWDEWTPANYADILTKTLTSTTLQYLSSSRYMLGMSRNSNSQAVLDAEFHRHRETCEKTKTCRRRC